MGLICWLPLMGTLENKGVSNITVTNNGATVDTSGKIGSCYSFNGNNYYMSLVGQQLFDCFKGGNQQFSMCMWVYHADSRRAVLFGDWSLSNSIGFNIELNTGHGVRFYWNGSPDYFPGINVGASIWSHITFTYDGTALRSYLNGNLIATRSGALAARSKTGGEFRLGRDNRTTETALNGKINDVRIYKDHCLSAAEVKEISQGLVLHYKLDNTPQGEITNAYNMSSWNTSATRGGFSAWGPSGHSGTSGNNTDRNYIYRSDRTYSYYISEDAGTGKYFIFYQSPAFEGGYRSLSAIIKEQNGMPINETICVPSWNANVTGSNYAPLNIWTRKISLGNGFYLCQVDGFYQNGSNDLVSINVLPGYKIYISEIWLEDNKQVCSNVLFPIEYIEDSSGYNHNGTIIGDLITVKDTKRYSAATKWNSTDPTNSNETGICYVQTPISITTPLQLSFSWWANPESGYSGSTGHAALCTSTNSLRPTDYNTTAFHHRDNGFDICPSDGSGSKRLSFTYTKNEWHYYTLTYDGTTARTYKDGIETANVTIGANKTLATFNQLYIGYSQAGGVKRKTLGTYSDFRMYVTALSADDILQLYHTSAKIDNKKNLHTYELIENSPSIKINKRGQTLCNELQEGTAMKFYKTDSIIETNVLNEF